MILPCHTAHDLLVVLGPTATGKTKLAVQLANKLGGEIISADSRQVYRGMDIGTGKDLNEYKLKKNNIPFHLIDIADPQDEYNVFKFQKDFHATFAAIKELKKMPILCGGTGFYIKAVLMDFHLPHVAPDKKIRKELGNWELTDLILELESISPGASQGSSLNTKRQIIRAIEIERHRDKKQRMKDEKQDKMHKSKIAISNQVVLGIEYSRQIIRDRITKRLHERIEQGMIQEVEILLNRGLTHKRLEQLGLEYRFISLYLRGKLTQKDMVEKLNTAIHQFAKRQMTFFRNIEKNGTRIHWIPGGDIGIAMDIISQNQCYH